LQALGALLLAINADGFNGDTMKEIPQEFYDAGMARGHPIAMEPEGSGAHIVSHIVRSYRKHGLS
jgi:hypothetical protein